MEKRDYIVIIAAIIIVLIMAVFVKPMLTGQQVVFLPSSQSVQTEMPNQEGMVPEESYVSPTPLPEQQQMTPAPVQVEEKPPSETLPSDVVPNVTPMSYQPDPSNPMPAVQMINYAEIIGKYTGQTNPFRIPTPYWELNYNVTPIDKSSKFELDIYELTDKGEQNIRNLIWHEGAEPNPQDLRFFEGGRDYYLKISADKLDEYRILIKIPLKYIRDT